MITTDNSDGWLCLEEWNCSGEKEFPLPLVLCASDLNWCPWGKCWNSPLYRACSGSLKIGCALCQICCSLNKDKVLTWSQIMGAKIHNSLQWFSLLSVKIMKATIERIGLNILNKRRKKKEEKKQLKNSWINVKRVDNVDNTRANETYYQISSQCLIHWTGC